MRWGLLVPAIVLAGCASLSLSTADIDADDWTTSGADGTRHSSIDVPFDPPLALAWEFDVGAGTGEASALIVDDVVLVGTRKGQLFGIDAERGKRIGRVRVDAPVEGGMAIAEGILLVPGAKRRAAAFGLDLESGKVRWKLRGESVEAGAAVVDSFAVFVGEDALLRVVRIDSGEERWTHALDSTATVIASPTVRGAVVYVADEEGRLYAIDVHNRRERWRTPAGTPVYQSLTLGGDLLFVPTTRGRLQAVDAETGQLRWRYAIPDTTVRFSPAAYDAKAGVLVIGGTDGFVRSLDARTGALVWEAQVGAPVSASPLIARHTVFAASQGRKLVALDRNTGLNLWEYETPGRVYSAMAASDALLIVLSEPQKVLAFRVAEQETGVEARLDSPRANMP